MSEPLVVRTDANAVATLALNRPGKLNALTPYVFEELQAHLEDLSKDESVGCVVLSGNGRAFCAGHDLESIGKKEKKASDLSEGDVIDLLEKLPQPTVAKLHGYCLTGGLELALGCDLLIAGAGTQLGDTHGRWGLAPIWGMSVRLPERIGRARAKELMFTSRRISGTTAAAIGLVDRCVQDEDLDRAVDELAAEIVANSWGTNRIDKALLAANAEKTREEALLFERSKPFGLPEDMRQRMTRGRTGSA